MVPLGLAQAATVRVAYQLGQQKPDGASRAGFVALVLGGLFSVGQRSGAVDSAAAAETSPTLAIRPLSRSPCSCLSSPRCFSCSTGSR